MAMPKSYSTLFLASVSLITAILQLALLPIIARYYEKESIALFGVINNYAAFFSLITSLGLLPLIVSVKSEVASKVIAKFTFFIALISSIVIFLILFFKMGFTYSIGEAFAFSFIIVSIFLLLFLFDLFLHLLLRSRNYVQLSKNKLSQAFSMSLVQIVGAFSCPNLYMLLGSRSVSLFMPAFKNIKIYSYLFRISMRDFISGLRILKKNKDVVLFALPNNIINLANRSLPYFFLIPFFDASYLLACYVLVNRLLDVPMNIYRNSVSLVVLKDFSAKFNSKIPFYSKLISVVFVTLVISILGYLILYFISGIIFGLLFGPDWPDFDKIFLWVLLPFITTLCLSPINQVLIITKLNKVSTFFLLVEFFAKISILLICMYFGLESFNFIVLFCLAGFAVQLLSMCYSLFILRRS